MRMLLVIVLTTLFGLPAQAADQVKVRFGEHPGFDRLVFDWPAPVGVVLQDSADQVRLNFDRAGDINLDRLRRDLPPGVRGVTTEAGPQGTSVVIAIAPGSKLRLLKNGTAAVLDILRPETPLNAPPARPDGRLGKPVPPSEIETAKANPNSADTAQEARAIRGRAGKGAVATAAGFRQRRGRGSTGFAGAGRCYTGNREGPDTRTRSRDRTAS